MQFLPFGILVRFRHVMDGPHSPGESGDDDSGFIRPTSYRDQKFRAYLPIIMNRGRHAIFGQFWPPPPVTLRHTSRDPQKYVTHLGPPPIFSRPSTKNPDKSPLYKFSLNCS